MRKRFQYITALLFFILPLISLAFAQDTTGTDRGVKHSVRTTFGGISGGPIVIGDHLDDSLAFTDPWMNNNYRVASFHLALKCNGNVVKYLENKTGNHLTAEMKQAILKLHPNCSLTFDGIKTLSRRKNLKNVYDEFDFGVLKLDLK